MAEARKEPPETLGGGPLRSSWRMYEHPRMRRGHRPSLASEEQRADVLPMQVRAVLALCLPALDVIEAQGAGEEQVAAMRGGLAAARFALEATPAQGEWGQWMLWATRVKRHLRPMREWMEALAEWYEGSPSYPSDRVEDIARARSGMQTVTDELAWWTEREMRKAAIHEGAHALASAWVDGADTVSAEAAHAALRLLISAKPSEP